MTLPPAPAPWSAPTAQPPALAYASLGARASGYFLDGMLPLVLLAPGFTMVMLAATSAGPIDTAIAVLFIGQLAILPLGLYQWWGVAKRGQTIGKRLAGTRVVDEHTGQPVGWGRAFLRYLVLGLLGGSFVLLLVQVFIVPSHPRRQGWHDLAARTVVIPASAGFTVPPVPATEAGWQDTPAPSPYAAPDLASPGLASPTEWTPPTADAAGPSLATDFPAAAAPPKSYGESTFSAPATPVPPPPLGSLVPPPPAFAPPTGWGPPASPDVAEPVGVLAEHTVMVHRPGDGVPPTTASSWRLLADDGTVIEVVDVVVVGRDPSTELVPDALVLAVPDPQRSMSKTHALLRTVEGQLTVEDLASTNGVHLVDGGTETRLPARIATPLAEGQRVTFGDRAFVVERAR